MSGNNEKNSFDVRKSLGELNERFFGRLRSLFQYNTARRLWNRVIISLDFALRRSRVSGQPIVLIADPVNICNLRCPLCPAGKRLPIERGMMKLETFTRIVEQLRNSIKEVRLFSQGEPLLNEQLYAMIKYAHDNRMRTVISSNLNIFNEKIAERLIDSGLDQLIVSFDGATQGCYEQYRVGGDLDKVIESVRLLTEKKIERKSATPDIHLQFIVFPHNRAEIQQAKEIAKGLGVAIYFREAILGGFPPRKKLDYAEKWACPDYQKEYDYFSDKPYIHEGPCVMLWKVAIVNWDGSVFPCCWMFDNKYRYGNINDQEFSSIWNNELFQNSRVLFGRSAKKSCLSEASYKKMPCLNCEMHSHIYNQR